MSWKLFLTVFGTVFIAELGDKTQLATLLYAADVKNPKLTVFLAASLALIAASALGVLLGSAVSKYLNEKYISWAAGACFIIIGIWTIVRA